MRLESLMMTKMMRQGRRWFLECLLALNFQDIDLNADWLDSDD